MIKIKNSAVFILALAVLAACNVSKNMEKPSAQLPVNFRNATENNSSIADVQWKHFFTDASLQKLIDKAITRNYDMQLAVKNIETSQLLLKQTKWAYLPDARLQVAASSTRFSDNSLNGLSAKQYLQTPHVEDYSANIALSWEADIWGKIKNQKASALASYLQSEEAKKAIASVEIAFHG